MCRGSRQARLRAVGYGQSVQDLVEGLITLKLRGKYPSIHTGPPARAYKAMRGYPNIESLLEGLISKKLRQSTANTLKTLLHEHTELVMEIRGLFRIVITGLGTIPCKECGPKQKHHAIIFNNVPFVVRLSHRNSREFLRVLIMATLAFYL